jgi:hypothetical protein
MRIALVLVGSLLLGTVAAQDPAHPKPEAPAKASAADRMQELQDLQQKVISDWRAATKAAQEAAKNATDGQPMKAMSMRPDFAPIAIKAAEYAQEFVGTDDAVPFLIMVVQSSTEKVAQKSAFETILKSHLDSPELAKIGGILEYLDQMIDAEFAATAKQRMLASKNVDVRGWALFVTHKPTIETGDREGDAYSAAKKALLAVAEGVADARLAQDIRGAIDMREKYGVGCESPDIAGIDLDGVEFKLSDYKGKVIFLDFWGDW